MVHTQPDTCMYILYTVIVLNVKKVKGTRNTVNYCSLCKEMLWSDISKLLRHTQLHASTCTCYIATCTYTCENEDCILMHRTCTTHAHVHVNLHTGVPNTVTLKKSQ